MVKKLKYIIIMVIIISLLMTVKSFARITSNDPAVNSGETVTITINSQEPVASGSINIKSNSGLTFQSVSGGTANGTKVAFAKSEDITSGIATYIFKAPEVTTDTTYKIVFVSEDMANANGDEVASSEATATVKVRAPEQKQEEPKQEEQKQEEQKKEEPKQEEVPNFSDTNKTMYATGDINLRDSWSTSSKATKISKGTELQVTATSTNKVNGYVWYRVKYEGATKYVASSLLTSDAPAAEEEKSNNANLKSLSIENVTLTPEFKADVTNYKAEVGNDIKEVTVKAETEDSKATVDVKGNKDLKAGENKITVSVSAEDGTVKIYEINVTKTDKAVLGLKTLKIKDTDIEKEFKTDKYSYTVSVKDVDKLDITTEATMEKATVEILENENLQDGENTVTIMVKSEDGKETVTYQIKVNKNMETAATQSNNGNKLDSRVYLYGGICLLALIILIALIVYLIKNKSKNEDEYDQNDLFDYDNEAQKQNYKNEFLNQFEDNKVEQEEINEEPKVDFNNDDDKGPDEPRRGRGKHF